MSDLAEKAPEKDWIQLFVELPVDQIPGWVGDAFDVLCKVEEVDGGIDVYFCSDEDDFELSKTPTVRFYGEPPTTRRMLLTHLHYWGMQLALTAIAGGYTWEDKYFLAESGCEIWLGVKGFAKSVEMAKTTKARLEKLARKNKMEPGPTTEPH